MLTNTDDRSIIIAWLGSERGNGDYADWTQQVAEDQRCSIEKAQMLQQLCVSC